jgi:hypothetical protein
MSSADGHKADTPKPIYNQRSRAQRIADHLKRDWQL